MKTKLLILTTAVLMLGLGCSKQSNDLAASGSDNGTATPIAPIGTGAVTSDSDLGQGQIVDFVPVTDTGVINTYVAQSSVNNPQNWKLLVNVKDTGSGQYAGNVEISYYDNGQYHKGKFTTGYGTVNLNENTYDGYNYAAFNQFFTFNGQKVFHGFFQDTLGAIVLVLDQTLDLGDGGGGSTANGSVYFRNFDLSRAPANPESIPCWFISIGPYDCRAFVSNGKVRTTSALYPSNYTKLGNFYGLNISKAFNQ